MKARKRSIILAIAGFLFADMSIAQILPGSVLPEQVGRAIQEEQPREEPKPLPTVVEEQPTEGAVVGEEAGKITFQLNGVRLEGNTVYSETVLKPLYKDKIGKEITVAELYGIVQNITNYYRNNGYVLSRAIIPPQYVQDGNVKIQIIEGFISQVKVTGHPHRACGIVQAMGDKIKACPPLQLSRLEKYLYLMNEIPGTTVRSVIAASKTEPAAADLTLVTETHPVTGYLSYDNYGTRYIGPQQRGAHLALNSLFTSGDSLSATYTDVPKTEQLTFFDMNYNMPLNAEGVRWIIGATPVKTNPGFVLEELDVKGINENYYTMVTFPIIRKKGSQLTTRIGFNYLDAGVDILEEKLYTDHIRNVDLGATYFFQDSWQGLNTINVDVSQGLPILGYTSDTNINTAETSRPGGHADYTKLFLTIERIQKIAGQFSLYGIFQGQISSSALLAAEQFAFGGSQLGRGYDAAELIGDEGMAGSLELRYDWLPQKFLFHNLQLYVFYDAGMILNFNVLNDMPRKMTATSTGFGARFLLTSWLSGNLMWTKPLTKKVSAEALVGQGKDARVFFSLVAALN